MFIIVPFVILLVVISVFIFVYAVWIYNRLIEVKNNVEKSWGNIEVLEKQRYDELPKLVEVCNAYIKYERDTLEKIVSARTRFLEARSPKDVAAADGILASSLKSLFAVAENYPTLKADANFIKIQNRISELESQIADRREFYNDSVNIYNIRISQIPYVFIARLMQLNPKEMFKVSVDEKVLPDLKFNQ